LSRVFLERAIKKRGDRGGEEGWEPPRSERPPRYRKRRFAITESWAPDAH